ncbi:hypothetical protein E2C01_040598 [Portunus trituberculatus]|uniref:Uncharacterized protein n=1 Tax=Portunus trituberculatus TaxID=210409 RepID=A0A5B7FPM8_PORTR|nr:hypothetical protein [Portunus trituberculatus]
MKVPLNFGPIVLINRRMYVTLASQARRRPQHIGQIQTTFSLNSIPVCREYVIA